MHKKKNQQIWLTLCSIAFILLLSMTAVAQELRSEVSVEGTGFFTKNTDGNRITNKPTNAGGILVGYRYRLYRWLSAETNYGYARDSQVFSGNTAARVQSNVHQVTGSAVIGLPQLYKFKPSPWPVVAPSFSIRRVMRAELSLAQLSRPEEPSFMVAAPITLSLIMLRFGPSTADSSIKVRVSISSA